MVPHEGEHLVHKHGRGLVAQVWHVNDPVGPLEFRQAEGLQESVLDVLVLVCCRRVLQQVEDPTGSVLIQCRHDVVVLRVICSDVPDVELGLCLHKPDFGLLGPELGQLEADCVVVTVRHGVQILRLTTSSVGVTNEVRSQG